MDQQGLSCAPGVRVILVANEKGGSGKSTVAIHVAIALLRAGESVATIDLDVRQRSFTHYVDNRLIWARQRGLNLPAPTHVCFDEESEYFTAGEDDAGCEGLRKAIGELAESHGTIVIDTPCQDTPLTRLVHGMAATLITPLNDSFVDLDVLASVDPENFTVSEISQYARLVDDIRRERREKGQPDLDWIVLRNRLSSTPTRNKRFVGEALQDLSQRLNFRCAEGLAERVIFREFYPRGLTAADELSINTLGGRPTMSHVTAQLEVQNLIGALLGPPNIAQEPEASGAANAA